MSFDDHIRAASSFLNDAAQPDASPAAVQPDVSWPDGVTARFLTRGSTLTRDRSATVDIHDDTARSTAICRPCGWTKDHGRTYRSEVLTWAQDHADQCTALGQPTA